ncbi:MAG: TIGR04442 family protein [Desulfuromonadales bacterium]|nr:TIGR04442 family protein [Desulfuromonadales bacterium]
MHKDIRLHGQMGDQIEFFVMVAGTEAYQHFFFNIVQDDDNLRIFSAGNEFMLSPEGIRHQGNGGYFCEYMFGMDQPSSDLFKPEIINRLVMYGARSDNETGRVSFSDLTSGRETFDTIFLDGNTVCNYFFFVHSSQMLSRKLKSQQEDLVKRIGKVLKRSESIGLGLDDTIVSEVFPLLKDATSQLFIIKLINHKHREYLDMFRQLYFDNKNIADEDFDRLARFAAKNKIDSYQQERMRIDVMYRHPLNKRVVDEYRNILLACNRTGEISTVHNARLTRLKTLSVRNKIPGALLHTLDEMLNKGCNLVNYAEQEYLASTREVLEGIFLREKDIESHIDHEDMLKLIRAKKSAMENSDNSFDRLMIDAGKKCDEKIRDGADPSLLADLSYVITYLDRFDTVANLVNQLAFMQNVRVTVNMLQEVLEHKAAFDRLRKSCFRELFIRELLENVYLGRFGRRKVVALKKGLAGIEAGTSSIEELHRTLTQIDQEEYILIVLLEHIPDRIRSFYSKFDIKETQEALRREFTEELKAKKRISSDIPDHLFTETILIIKKESMYLHTLLPTIVSECNLLLREDFLENSGLDRFYVEELERDYFEKNGLDLEDLYQIRKGLN